MCSNFVQSMDNYQGDLADIVRASGGTISTTTTTTTTTDDQIPSWLFGSSDNTSTNQQQQQQQQSSYEQLKDLYTFSDPLLRDIDAISSPGPLLDMGAQDTNNITTSTLFSATPSIHFCNIFPSSRMVQISPTTSNNNHNNSNSNISSNVVKLPILSASQKVTKNRGSFGFMSNNEMMSCSSSPNKDGFMAGVATGFQIPSPRNSGIKRRKTQAKKVVCIPAPAAANSRQTGEVVPSDLWAWRKYGQKPIKGSPFPRGYYRCSSSKGCSARKQVERSRTDPNMLVITYTSEHNHPWPTQRNALAGSSRGQPSSKGTSGATPTHSNENVLSPSQNDEVVKEEANNIEVNQDKDVNTSIAATSLANSNNASGSTSTTQSSIKEEEGRISEQAGNINASLRDEDINQGHGIHHQEFNDNYRPMIIPETSDHHQADQDFFTDLVDQFEDDDPLNLLFTQ